MAQKPGFAREGNPALFILPRVADAAVEIPIAPLGAIEGTVVNEYDEVLENVVLNVYQLAIRDGERSASNVGTVWTDDLGQYDLAYMEPGNYAVRAASMRGGTETHFGIHAMRYAPWEGFSPVYFGGADNMESAAPISVAPGARVRVDFRLDVQRSF